MKPIRLLVDSLADEDLPNAQMGNAREIMGRLNPRFHVTTFGVSKPDARIVQRPNTRIIRLGPRLQTLRILREFFWGEHDILFYIKGSPAARIYLRLRQTVPDKRIVIGMVESQSNLHIEPTITRKMIRNFERTVLRADILFSNSNNVRASLETEYGFPSQVVPTGVDTRFFSPAWDRRPNSRLRVLFVGSLRPFKGPQLLLRAASRFPAAEFVIAGDGVMAPELRAQVDRERLVNVRLMGSVRPCVLRQQYCEADIFLFPSHWEGSPKVIMEAAACGLPVIARRDYKPETVIDGKTGLLGSSDDQLLEHLSKLIGDAELRHEMGRAGRAHIEQFDWDLITRRWEEIFENLISGRGNGT